MTIEVDVIGGFPYAEPNCKGCGEPLTVRNACMTDGCSCNSPLGINSMNETRWRLLMELQQKQSQRCEIVNALDRLREPEGATVTFCCDNPDFNSLPNSAIVVIDDWTDHFARRFTGDSVLECLRAAEKARTQSRENSCPLPRKDAPDE